MEAANAAPAPSGSVASPDESKSVPGPQMTQDGPLESEMQAEGSQVPSYNLNQVSYNHGGLHGAETRETKEAAPQRVYEGITYETHQKFRMYTPYGKPTSLPAPSRWSQADRAPDNQGLGGMGESRLHGCSHLSKRQAFKAFKKIHTA